MLININIRQASRGRFDMTWPTIPLVCHAIGHDVWSHHSHGLVKCEWMISPWISHTPVAHKFVHSKNVVSLATYFYSVIAVYCYPAHWDIVTLFDDPNPDCSDRSIIPVPLTISDIFKYRYRQRHYRYYKYRKYRIPTNSTVNEITELSVFPTSAYFHDKLQFMRGFAPLWWTPPNAHVCPLSPPQSTRICNAFLLFPLVLPRQIANECCMSECRMIVFFRAIFM